MVAKKRGMQAKSRGISVFDKMIPENPWQLTWRVRLGWTVWTAFALSSPMAFSSVFLTKQLGIIGCIGVAITTFILVNLWNTAAAPIIKMLDASRRIVKESIPKGLNRKSLTTDGVRKRLRELPSAELDRLYIVFETEPQLIRCRNLCRKSLVDFTFQVLLWIVSIVLLASTDGIAGGFLAALSLLGSAIYGIKALRSDDLEVVGEKLTKARDAVTTKDPVGVDGVLLLGFDLVGAIRKALPTINRRRSPKSLRSVLTWATSLVTAAAISVLGTSRISIYISLLAGCLGTFYSYQMASKGLIRLSRLPRIDSKYRDFAKMADISGSKLVKEFAFDLRRTMQVLKGAGQVSRRCLELYLAGFLLSIPLWFAAETSAGVLLTSKLVTAFTVLALIGCFLAENPYIKVAERVEDVVSRLERIEALYGYTGNDINDDIVSQPADVNPTSVNL